MRAPGRLLPVAAVLLVLSATAAAAAGPPSPSPRAKNPSLRIALLAGEELPFLGLLEAGLMENIPASWVERNEIKKVLTEPELQAAFGADAPQRRTALGKILRADLLVLVRSAEDSQPHLEVVVCETRQGLRLSVQPIRLTTQPETAVAAVTRLVQQAIEKERQKIVDIVAVPPLMNMSLGREADYLQRAYAGLIEGCLLERPGVLVVELAEADAIAREIALSGGTIERRLPLYLLGQYRIEMAAGQPAGQFTLKLLRGKRPLDSRREAALVPERMAAKIRAAALEMLDKALGQRAEPSDPATEARQLARCAEAFQAVGDWPEALNLVEASLLLNPSQPRLHRDAAEILGTMASELDPFHDPSRPQANTKAVAYLRASLPHLEAFYRETRVEPRDVAAVQSCWGALRWRVASPLGDRRIDRECRELYEDLTRMCGSVLAAKAAAKVQDYSLSQLAPYSEMPRPSGSTDAMVRWDAESLPACCRHRLELLKAFQYLEVPQFGRLLWIDAGWPRDWDQPAYLKFLDEAEKLSRPEVVREARRVRAYIVSTRTWRPPPAPLPARPAIDRGAAEVAFRRIDLMVRRPNGGEAFYSGCPLLWLPACDGMDVVLDEWALYVMRRPGRLVPLALPGHPNPNFAAGRQVTNACWDGRYVWFASPAANPGTPKRATGGGQSGLEYAPEGKPFLAAVEPATGKVWTFSAADGLPPMQSPGGPAVTPLEPGKICLAGHFGRSWCGVATLDPAAGIKLDIFYEAREVDPETNPANGQNVRLASPVVFLCTLTSAAAAGGPPQQRVLLNRQAAGTLLLDPRTRSVRLLPYRIPPETFFCAHDGMLYWEGFRRADNRTELYRTGFPDFHMELVNPESQFGFCLIEGNRLHVLGDRAGIPCWCLAARVQDEVRRLRGPVPWTSGNILSFSGHIALSRHYGLIYYGEDRDVCRVEFPAN